MQNKPGVPSSFGNVVKLEFLITVKLKGFLRCLARMLTNFHETFAKHFFVESKQQMIHP